MTVENLFEEIKDKISKAWRYKEPTHIFISRDYERLIYDYINTYMFYECTPFNEDIKFYGLDVVFVDKIDFVKVGILI